MLQSLLVSLLVLAAVASSVGQLYARAVAAVLSLEPSVPTTVKPGDVVLYDG